MPVKNMAKARMDEHGRVQIPTTAIKRLGLKSGTEFELKQDDGVLVLKPIVHKHRFVKSPPLSPSEIAEIEESEKEFATQPQKVYDSTSDLIDALHAERQKTQKAKKRTE